MTIPFSNLFKKARARFGKQPELPRPAIVRPPMPEKTAAERLSKTVLPNATRTVAPVDPFQVAAGATGRGRMRESSASSFQPPAERTIALTLGDLLDNLPSSSIKPRESLDVNRNISLKAAEVEKGMATGQPTALLVSIYEQVPDIFRQSVPLTDVTAVPLPFDKVMQQFQALQVRADQLQDEAVPQLETPFLQVTIQDTQKFGTSLTPLQTSAKPPVKVEPATARSIAKAEPEPVAQQKQTPKIRARSPISLTPQTESAPLPAASPSPSPAESGGAPTRLPFKLPPNGAGAPASERVPASSGPPVPTPPPAPPKSAAPTRIPFRMTPPGAELKPKLTLVPGVDPAESEPAKTESPAALQPAPVSPTAESARSDGVLAKLRLNVCLRNLPAFQLSRVVPDIADGVLIELPFSLIEPQLATGRVAIDPKVFQAAIPEQDRTVFVMDSAETPVLLPLQEVLQHLPGTALRMRADQEHEEAIDHFETPFSHHAKEDQKRFGKPAGEAPEPAALKVTDSPADSAKPEPTTPEAKTEENVAPVASAEPEKAPKTKAKQPKAGSKPKVEDQPAATPDKPATDQQGSTPPATAEAKNNAKEFVLRISCLPGVAGCSIAFADGLTMAGNLPPNLGADGLCAVAPSVLQKVHKHMLETDLGSLNSMTLNCSKSPISFFMEGNVCLTVLHTDTTLEPVTQEQLVQMTKELAQIFAQPETTNVDH